MTDQKAPLGLETAVSIEAEARAFDDLAARARSLGEARKQAASAGQRRAGCVEALSSMTLDEASRRLG